ncbi:MAG TPA: patatin-like phospholipase family protein [Coxiellaceae bacterium]|nr:patatin-like phospholipase family protein [Coxiellaceae bacterium]
MPKPLALKQRPDVALVLGAGGARGFAQAGAVYTLQRAGVPIDLIVGSSVGSFYGALLADNGNATQAAHIMLTATFWDIADIANIPSLSGLMQGYHYQKFLLKNMRARWFNQLKIPLVIVTTDLKTGKAFVISSGPVAPAAEASASIPGVVRPAHLYGRTLVDGGMVDPVPATIAESYHPKVIIAINIAQTLSKHMPWAAPGVYDRAFHISWLQLSALSENGADIVIHPGVGDAGTFDVSQKYTLFHEGEVAAQKALPRIKRLLKRRNIRLVTLPSRNRSVKKTQ